MEPKYKLHARITELSKWHLLPISAAQKEWGQTYALDKFFHTSRGKLYCLECGHKWTATNKRKQQTCPECATKLQRISQYYTGYRHAGYFAVLEICGGYQIVRIVWVSKILKLNEPAQYYAKEVMQHYITEKAEHVTMCLPCNAMSQPVDCWNFSKEMKVQESRGNYKAEYRHNIPPYTTHPEAQILPVFKRNGFDGNFYGISPLKFFKELISDQYFETLLKAKQGSLLSFRINRSLYGFWPSVKICIRNNYKIKDAVLWTDYIDLLKYFNKDVHNAHYVCPKNLKAEHDRLMVKKRKKQALEKIEKQKQRISEANAEYLKAKANFLDLTIQEADLKIMVLPDVSEFLKEGDELHHCVFTNEYYKKSKSLILSARKKNKRLETVEVSLDTFDILQSRGIHNSETPYHSQIISLIQNNMDTIRKRAV